MNQALLDGVQVLPEVGRGALEASQGLGDAGQGIFLRGCRILVAAVPTGGKSGCLSTVITAAQAAVRVDRLFQIGPSRLRGTWAGAAALWPASDRGHEADDEVKYALRGDLPVGCGVASDGGEQDPDRVPEGEVRVALLHATEELGEAGAKGMVLGDADRQGPEALRKACRQPVEAGDVAEVFDLGKEAVRLELLCGICHRFDPLLILGRVQRR